MQKSVVYFKLTGIGGRLRRLQMQIQIADVVEWQTR